MKKDRSPSETVARTVQRRGEAKGRMATKRHEKGLCTTKASRSSPRAGGVRGDAETIFPYPSPFLDLRRKNSFP